MFNMFLPPRPKKRKTNEEIVRDRMKSALGLDIVEDVCDVTSNIIDSLFSLGDD